MSISCAEKQFRPWRYLIKSRYGHLKEQGKGVKPQRLLESLEAGYAIIQYLPWDTAEIRVRRRWVCPRLDVLERVGSVPGL